jgi:hypothetical protein
VEGIELKGGGNVRTGASLFSKREICNECDLEEVVKLTFPTSL